jgi:hypothetical protein
MLEILKAGEMSAAVVVSVKMLKNWPGKASGSAQ